MRKRDKLYKRMKRSCRPNDPKKFFEYKHLVRRVTDMAYERYLGDILGINTTTEQEENSPPKLNTKKMYSLLKHSNQDSSPIKVGWKDPLWRLWEIKCPKQTIPVCFQPQIPGRLKFFSSVKLQELNDQGCNLPFQSSPYSQMPQSQISVKGIEKCLNPWTPTKQLVRTCPFTASDLPEVTWLREAKTLSWVKDFLDSRPQSVVWNRYKIRNEIL